MNKHFILALVCLMGLPLGGAFAQAAKEGAEMGINLTDAVVVTPGDLSSPEQKAVAMLIDEVAKRTRITWRETHEWPAGAAVVAVGPAKSLAAFAGPRADAFGSAPDKAEGYRLRTFDSGGAPAAIVAGNDVRGVLYGIGRLLRELRMERDGIHVTANLDVATAPAVKLRGHQLGYRPKTNSYDAWTPAMWEQYIRDLAVFGANAVELIPPRSDDAPDSPHFPLPQIEMMKRMSQICDDYGIDVWVWYPALDKDYTKSKDVEFALNEWGSVFAQLPRIDHVIVPGGDPGHTPPRPMLDLLAKQTEVLHHTHPKAGMWMSPQGFTKERMDEFLNILCTEQPKWLTGIVFGPQNRVPLPELRKVVPPQYAIRLYPDITHTVQCQFPVPEWSYALAITEQRECVNPRPTQYARIFRLTNPDTIGFLTYSEGCNDDINKTIWSGLGWRDGAGRVASDQARMAVPAGAVPRLLRRVHLPAARV
ncbi:MAG: hypothetical protein NTU83_00435 [Candidatus Hydrogenedentes bacterium]|nr:hypothetical protein [Candidatus Hydrogenedentota bacterium]